MKKPKTYADFKKQFEEILMERHGITINDCTDEEQLQREFNDGSSPEEFIEWIADKHGLDRIDLEPFTRKKKKV